MEIKAPLKRTGITLPLLTAKGAVLLFAGVLVPLGGALINLELHRSAALVALYLIGAALVLLNETFGGLRIMKALKLEVGLPERALSGIEQQMHISAELPRVQSEQVVVLIRVRIPYRVRASQDRLKLIFLPGAKRAEADLQFTPLGRGTVRFAGLDVRIKRAGGTLNFQQHYQFNGAALRVFPDHTCGSKNADPAILSASIGQRALQEVYSEGREFDSLREYAVGDDLRRVDWKRSSRSRSLLVKVYRPESHQRVMIALDCGRRMGNLVGDRFLLDYAADGAANLLHVIRRHDDEVGFFAFHHDILAQLESRRTKTQEKRIVDELIKLKPGQLDADYELLTLWGKRTRRRSLFLLVTSVSNPLGLEALREALLPLVGKHLPLVVTIADRALVSLASRPADDLEDAYIIAAANQQLQGIESRVQWLKRSGIECVYADAGRIGAVIAENYARLKLSGKL